MPPAKSTRRSSSRSANRAAEAGASVRKRVRPKSASGAKREHSPTVGKYLREYQRKRDFRVTAEPSGSESQSPRGAALQFVVQKHAASHLHFDLRLEVDGVMKSWAVPKGPSVDPDVKRLAMEVEDHPMAYNSFEGTIPHGEYGGGTVMLWDRGTYAPDEMEHGERANDTARRALKAGKLAFTFHGERLHGSFALVRTRRGEERSQWLLFKHRDKYAKRGRDIVASIHTSVESGRTMEEIAANNNPEVSTLDVRGSIAAMQATTAKSALPAGEYALTDEPEGTRVLAFLTNGTVKLSSGSNGKRTKADQLLADSPGVSDALLRMSRNYAGALILDGYVSNDRFVVVDLLLDGTELLVEEPWIERQTRLAALLNGKSRTSPRRQTVIANDWTVVSSDDFKSVSKRKDDRTIIAKRIDAPYESGRSKFWLRVSA